MDFYEWERVFDKCSTPSIGKNCDHVAWSFTQLWTDMQIQCFGELTSVIFTLQKCHPFSEEPYWPLLSLNEAYFLKFQPARSQNEQSSIVDFTSLQFWDIDSICSCWVWNLRICRGISKFLWHFSSKVCSLKSWLHQLKKKLVLLLPT